MNCPVCGENLPDDDIKAHHKSPHNDQNYQLHNCPSCGLNFWNPLSTDTSIYLDDGFEAYADYHQGRRPLPPWCKPFLSTTPTKGGKILDIGCGDGSFLMAAKELGFEVHGIDLDRRSVQIANTKYGLDSVHVATLEEYAYKSTNTHDLFDIVSIFEVLEHQDKPNEFMTSIKILLSGDGFVVGSVPNRRRFLSFLDRRFGIGDLPPHHFLWFSKTSLENFLSINGFINIQIIYCGNTPFRQLNRKVFNLMFGDRYKNIKFVQGICQLLALPFTALLSAGYAIYPTHLYFMAKKTK